MMPPLTSLIRTGGDIRHDVTHFLIESGFPDTATHVVDVADEAVRLAAMFGVSQRRPSWPGCCTTSAP